MSKQYRLQNNSANEIVKILSRNEASGSRPSDIFRDWLDLVDAVTLAAPNIARHVQQGGDPMKFEDTPETQAVFQRLRSRYRRVLLRQLLRSIWCACRRRRPQ